MDLMVERATVKINEVGPWPGAVMGGRGGVVCGVTLHGPDGGEATA